MLSGFAFLLVAIIIGWVLLKDEEWFTNFGKLLCRVAILGSLCLSAGIFLQHPIIGEVLILFGGILFAGPMIYMIIFTKRIVQLPRRLKA